MTCLRMQDSTAVKILLHGLAEYLYNPGVLFSSFGKAPVLCHMARLLCSLLLSLCHIVPQSCNGSGQLGLLGVPGCTRLS